MNPKYKEGWLRKKEVFSEPGKNGVIRQQGQGKLCWDSLYLLLPWVVTLLLVRFYCLCQLIKEINVTPLCMNVLSPSIHPKYISWHQKWDWTGTDIPPPSLKVWKEYWEDKWRKYGWRQERWEHLCKFFPGVVTEWSSQTVLFTSEKLSPRDNWKEERQDSLRPNSPGTSPRWGGWSQIPKGS